MISKTIPLIANSDTVTGARDVSADGSTFTFEMIDSDGLNIPANAFDIYLEVIQSTIWWVIPNILENSNDKMYINYSSTDYTLTIPQGLYGVGELNNAISLQLQENSLTADLISIVGDEPTGKIILQLNYSGITIDWTVGKTDTFRDILGFDIQTVGPNASPQNIYGDNVAVFNTLNFFLLHSDLTNQGIPYNGTYSKIIGKVQIDVPVGDQVTYEPRRPIPVSVDNLKGSTTKRARFWLTSDQNVLVNTNNEPWSVTLLINYKQLLK